MRMRSTSIYTLHALSTTWRLHVFAALWLLAVGVIAFWLSKLAPEPEAASGVVLAAIALGAYRLSGWAIDLLGALAVERCVALAPVLR